MTAAFLIEAEPARHLIRLTLTGFMCCEEVERFGAEVRQAIGSLPCGINQHVTICDVSSFKLQAQTVVTSLQALIVDPQLMSRRLALVVGDSSARMQARRVLTRDNAKCFEDTAEAEAWLFSAEEQAAA